MILTVGGPAGAILVALGLGAGVIWLSGASVLVVYGGLLAGMVGSWHALSDTAVAATPYIFTGLSVVVAWRGGLFNIGAEGQLYMGALGAAVAGGLGEGLTAGMHVPLVLGVSALGGALWGAIPGFLKARFGAHEVINTMMMNYLAVKLVDYLVKGILRDATASLDRTAYILSTAHLPLLWGTPYRLHAGLLLALLLACAVAWGLSQTTVGFVVRTVGANPQAARYAGMPIAMTMVGTMALAGALAGLAGAGEVLGLYHALPATFASGYGFEAIAVALLGRTHPLGVVPAAVLWGGLRSGASLMQVRSGLPGNFMHVLQAFILLGLAIEPLWRRLRQQSSPATR